MIARDLETCLHEVFVEARQARHEFVSVEHLLLALLDNSSISKALRACHCDIEDLRKRLEDFISKNTPLLPPSMQANSQPTLGFQRVIQNAILHVQSSSGKDWEVTAAAVLIAIFHEKDTHAVYYLQQHGVTLDAAKFMLAAG